MMRPRALRFAVNSRSVEASFSRLKSMLGEIQIERQTLQGRPAEVLKDLAVNDDYDVIVVGCAGRGMSKRLLGSTAESLTADSPVSIVVGHRQRNHAEQDADLEAISSAKVHHRSLRA